MLAYLNLNQPPIIFLPLRFLYGIYIYVMDHLQKSAGKCGLYPCLFLSEFTVKLNRSYDVSPAGLWYIKLTQ